MVLIRRKMSYTDVILSCLEANVANAKTKAMRAFAEEQLLNFRETRNKAKKTRPEMPTSISRFLDVLDSEYPEDLKQP